MRLRRRSRRKSADYALPRIFFIRRKGRTKIRDFCDSGIALAFTDMDLGDAGHRWCRQIRRQNSLRRRSYLGVALTALHSANADRIPLHKFSLALFRCVSACSRHAAIAEIAARPSQGSSSRNVMTMVALSWSFMILISVWLFTEVMRKDRPEVTRKIRCASLTSNG